MKTYIKLLIGSIVAVLVGTLGAGPALANAVVGNGTPASCTNQALINAVQVGGLVTFNCGPNPHTITINNTINYDGQSLPRENRSVTIDGGNRITLRGTPGNRIFYVRTFGDDRLNPQLTLTLRNLIVENASLSGAGTASNGAAVYATNFAAVPAEGTIYGPIVRTFNVTFRNNTSTLTSVPALPRYPYDYGGAAIYVANGTLEVTDSNFTGNVVNGGTGAAIHGLRTNITIVGSTFQSNRATGINGNVREDGYAGALYVDGALDLRDASGFISIVGSTFQSNRAVNQGGAAYINLYNQGDRDEFLTIDTSRFIDNQLTGGEIGFGGAISAGSTGGQLPITITRSSFVGNVATNDGGGGLGGALGFAQPADVRIANSTFTQNRAELVCNPPSACGRGRGGAISIGSNSAGLEIINSTIVDNYAGWRAGGINSRATTTLRNTIIANNQAASGDNAGQIDCSGTYSGGNNLQSVAGNPCVTNIQRAALSFEPLTNGYLAPSVGSPAIDAGQNAACTGNLVSSIDQRGVGRPLGAGCDIGAIEYIDIDVIADGRITPQDAAFVINRVGQPAGGTNAPANVDGDGDIDQTDVNLVIEALGSTP